MSPGAMYQSDKIIRRIWFGYDKNNIYVRLDTTQPMNQPNYEIYIYAYNPGIPRTTNNIRLRVTSRELPITFRYKYAYEISLITKIITYQQPFLKLLKKDYGKLDQKTTLKQQ